MEYSITHVLSNPRDPVFTIGVVSKILNISPETLRLYEKEGLVIAYRTKTRRRMYSQEDIDWIACIRYQIKCKRLNISGIRHLIALLPCWEINRCKSDHHTDCIVYLESSKICWQLDKKPCRLNKTDCYTCPVYRMAPKIENLKAELNISLKK